MKPIQKLLVSTTVLLLPLVLAAQAPAQNPAQVPAQDGEQAPAPAGRGGGRGAQGRGGPPAYPARTPDPAMVARGSELYGVNCAFCHGRDTRGGDTGPSLLRSQLVLADQNGELLAQVVQSGRPPQMPKFDFTTAQIADIAAFLHSFPINSRDPARVRPENILTGEARAGETYFNAKCAACHSATGNLKGIGAKITDPRTLQQWWLLPGGGGRGGRGATPPPGAGPVPPTTATITTRSGEVVEGTLVQIDEFIVTIADKEGVTRSFARNGETPLVEVHDPLQPHKAMLRVLTDKDIHDVTAYLVTLK